MQAAEAAVISSPAMAQPYRAGRDVRRAIMDALKAAAAAKLPAPSAVALAEDLQIPRSTIQRNVAQLVEWGWVTTRGGRTGGVILTQEGSEAAG